MPVSEVAGYAPPDSYRLIAHMIEVIYTAYMRGVPTDYIPLQSLPLATQPWLLGYSIGLLDCGLANRIG